MNSNMVPTAEAADDRMDIGQKVMIGVTAAVIIVGGYFLLTPSQPAEGDQPLIEPPQLPVVSVMNPVLDGDKKYTLGGLEWVFEEQSVGEDGTASTRVRLRLVDFKRNDVPVEVALYRLGTYRGECESFDVFDNARAVPDEGALAFAQCWLDGTGRQLVVFQEDKNLVVKVRSVSEDDEQLAALTPILTIAVPAIIQPTH